MTEPTTKKAVFSPTETIWTLDLEGNMQMWSVDGTGRPTLMVAGDPPFPAPEGEPFRQSMMSLMLRRFAIGFGMVALVLSIVGIITGNPDLGRAVTWAAIIMFVLIILIGFSHYRDKQRALRR